MIIARAAKGAALLLMIFGVVALIGCPAATSGATGKTGAAGAKGDKGDTGAAGAPGSAALQAVGDADARYPILINNGGTTAVPAVGDVTKPSTSADVSTLFVGGVKPITYTVSAVTGGPFMASIKAGESVITVTKRSGASGNLVDPGSYATGTTLTVRATDANGVTAVKNVAIRANRKPIVEGAEDHVRRNVIVGTQSEDMGPTSDPDYYKAKNVATIMDLRSWNAGAASPAQPNPYFSDDGDDSTMKDDDLGDHTLEITKLVRGADDAGNAADHLTAELVAGENGDAANGIKLTGLKSTWDSSLDTPAHVPVVITLKATDPGGLSAETTISVIVDGAPEQNTAPPASAVKKATGTQGVLIRGVDDFYKDPEQAAGTGLLVAAGDVVVTPSTSGTGTIDSGNLALTPNNPGSATVSYILRSNPIPAEPGTTTYLTDAYLDRDGDGESDTGATQTPGVQAVRGTLTVTITP